MIMIRLQPQQQRLTRKGVAGRSPALQRLSQQQSTAAGGRLAGPAGTAEPGDARAAMVGADTGAISSGPSRKRRQL